MLVIFYLISAAVILFFRLMIVIMVTLLMLLISMHVYMLMVVIMSILHAFHDFFFQDIHIIHHGDHAARAIRLTKRIRHFRHPLLHGSAVADQHIRILYGNHICRCRLKGVAVHSCRNHQSQPDSISRDLPQKIVVGKQRGHHIQAPVFLRLPYSPPAAAGQQAYCQKA